MEVKPNLRFRAFYLIFILYSAQTGVGVMGLPRYIFKEAHRDSWISILIAYVFMVILLYVMFHILKQYESADIFGIQVDVFGRFFGTILGSRSEEHTSELQSRENLVCRLLLEK